MLDPFWAPSLADGVLDIFTLPDTPLFELADALTLGLAQGEAKITHLSVEDIPCGDTSSDKAVEKTRHWLDECTTNHTHCGSKVQRQLPTRVLDLRRFSWPHSTHISLLVSNSETGDYACLSHCWGKTKSITTTRKNLSTHKQEIPWSSLPKTFQETIMFTSKLSIDFLRIDSLCIIQDDGDDWEKESAKMASIYTNNVVTIAAMKSPDHVGGLFANALTDYTAHPIPAHDIKGCLHTIYARKRLPHYPAGLNVYEQQKHIYPLLSRAWVYQERFLSPRVLHFTQNELWWECNTLEYCECGYLQSPSLSPPEQAIVTLIDKQFRSPKIARAASINQNSSLLQLTAAWRESVQGYSALALTFEKDTLPALSGLAKQMQNYRKDNYIAGLWESTLLQDLVWTLWLGYPSRRHDEWIAPTWSWASIQGIISFHYCPSNSTGSDFRERQNTSSAVAEQQQDYEIYASLLDNVIVPEGSDSTGRILSGHIILSAPVIAGKLEYLSRSYNGEPERRQYGFIFPGGETRHIWGDYKLREETRGFVPEGESVYTLRVLRVVREDVCLVLRRSLLVSGAFERIGVLNATTGWLQRRRAQKYNFLRPSSWKDVKAEEHRIMKLV
jgi:hypothetical protein